MLIDRGPNAQWTWLKECLSGEVPMVELSRREAYRKERGKEPR